MAIINPWTVLAAGKAIWNGYKWVKKIKKLKKKTKVTVEKLQRSQKPYRPTPKEEAKTVITQSAIMGGAVVGLYAGDSGSERAKKIRNKKKKGSQIAHKKYLREK